MSNFKSKDLEYDAGEPAFLRRLRGQIAGDGSIRHDAPIARNKRMKQDDEDDAPTYVLEDSNQSLSKEEYEAMVSGKDPENPSAEIEKAPKPDQNVGTEKPKDRIVEAGQGVRKRKAVKVGAEGQDEDALSKVKDSKVTKKPKKKAKKVKLSFGDQEEG
ncbi:hypothetical protein BCR34DRAFT_588925 [Clohesyomyces aquaticus]|uniref:DUF4604 domain-containing protein n=1 Tax=Clohesyomyces aquaticus TaxID=1231657 RepID=A0A1Y1ZIA5_9PLEO|nr:hypothetical protein BCR34DRAFT_588925 [Clohesyomyces aquaticus]